MTRARRLAVPDPFDLPSTMAALVGPGGSSSTVRNGVHYRASRNEAGPFQLALTRAVGGVAAEAWGDGAGAALDRLPLLLGLDDDADTFDPPLGPIRDLHRRRRGLRLGATGAVFEVLAPTVLGQRVTSGEAKDGYRRLVHLLSRAAPGPAGLYLPLEPDQVASLGYEEFHRCGVERSRALILREAARRSRRLEETLTMDRAAAYRRLEAVRGVGPWTSGHVMGVAWGDRDAVPVGDFHLPNTIAWVLAGEPRADDQRMLQLLEPHRPHRRRVVQLVKQSGVGAPKYGPRSAIHDIEHH